MLGREGFMLQVILLCFFHRILVAYDGASFSTHPGTPLHFLLIFVPISHSLCHLFLPAFHPFCFLDFQVSSIEST